MAAARGDPVSWGPAVEGEGLAEIADIETASEEYARRFAGPVGRYFLDVQAHKTLALLEDVAGSRVLDVGGGHAQLAVPLARAGFRVTVTGSADSCRERLDTSLPPGAFEFRRCDVLDLPYAGGEFEAVIAFRLLPHVEAWQALLAELCRVARRFVVVDYPDTRSFNAVQRSFFGWKKAIEGNTRTFRCFSRRDLLREFAAHGFGRAVFVPQFFVPMAIHRAVRSVRLSKGVEGLSRMTGLTHRFGSPVIVRVTRGGESSRNDDGAAR